MRRHGSSFSSLQAYGWALAETPKRVACRAWSVSTSFDETSKVRARSGSTMQKSLRWFDLIGLRIGSMVGAGVYVIVGIASRSSAGPAVVLSYAIAGLCTLLSAFCYTELAIEVPVAGGPFSYLRVTFGEFLAFLTGANLVMEYLLSNAAIARSFTTYLGAAIGISNTSEKWRIKVSALPNEFNKLDLIAVALVLVITLCICYSTKRSSVLNMVLTLVHILIITFVITMGFWRGHWKNLTEPSDPTKPNGFFPYGVSGVFNGAAMVYFSYVGYDAISSMTEEVQNPTRDIPIGVLGSVLIVTIIYCLMATSMSKLVPYDLIDIVAPLSSAFLRTSKSCGWVSNVIGGGASFGILTSLLVSMMGQTRFLCAIGRSNVVPSWFAKVHPVTSTPINASVFLGTFTAAIALFMDFSVLASLVSIGTLFVFYLVANAVIYIRYVPEGTTTTTKKSWPTLLFLLLLSTIAIIFTVTWRLCAFGKVKVVMLGGCTMVAVVVVQVFRFRVPQARRPELWGLPLMPWIPAISIFFNMFLLGSLDTASYLRFGLFSVMSGVIYVFYSVHASYDAEQGDDDGDYC